MVFCDDDVRFNAGHQKTLKSPVKLTGVGLHSGCLVNCHVIPAPENTGVIFRRIDLPRSLSIRVCPANITSTQLCTTIAHPDDPHHEVATIEHLMAALWGLGIDNALIEIDHREVPIGDGSAAFYYDSLSLVGTRDLDARRSCYRLKKPLTVTLGGSRATLSPGASFDRGGLSLECTIDFSSLSSVIGCQSFSLADAREQFLSVMDARTFCRWADVQTMQKNGLALGGSLDNAVVVSEDAVMNGEGLRYEDEFVRHKVLDALGDLAILGHDLHAHLSLHRPGHSLLAHLTQTLSRHSVEYLQPLLDPLTEQFESNLRDSADVAAPLPPCPIPVGMMKARR